MTVNAPLSIPKDLVEHLPEHLRSSLNGLKISHVDPWWEEVTPELVSDLSAALSSVDSNSNYSNAVDALVDAYRGEFRSIKHPYLFGPVLVTWLEHEKIDGWVYALTPSGSYQPLVITEMFMVGSEFRVYLSAVSPLGHPGPFSWDTSNRRRDRGLESWGQKTVRCIERRSGKPETIMRDLILAKETAELREAHFERSDRVVSLCRNGIGVRAEINGVELRPPRRMADDGLRDTEVRGRVGIIDMHPDLPPNTVVSDSGATEDFEHGWDDGDTPAAPLLTFVCVFDVAINDFVWVDVDHVQVHQYDESLREKIILPQTHRHLIDVLSESLTEHTGDLVRGKTSGNMVLCKGVPGVGKTLTAEVYAETMHKPLYRLDMSVLLSSREASLRASLEYAIELARHWDAVMLLDEADVLLGARGENMERNRMTGEFLQVTEYVDRLTFVTTNRPDDIDEAVISRCAAQIEYQPPTGDDAARTWRTLAAINDIELTDGDVEELLIAFPSLPPRTMRQLLRLAATVASKDDVPVDHHLIKRYSVFQGLTPSHQ